MIFNLVTSILENLSINPSSTDLKNILQLYWQIMPISELYIPLKLGLNELAVILKENMYLRDIITD